MTTDEPPTTPVAALPTNDRHVSTWQAQIAEAAKHGKELDTFRAALEDIKHRYSIDADLLDHAKREIWGPPTATLLRSMA